MDVIFASDNSDLLSYKDSGGVVRTLVTTDNVQSLSNKTEPATTYAVDGALSPVAGTAILSKGSAGAYTLAAPTAAQVGSRLIITSISAFAHVVTATDLIDDGVTGGAKDTLTFGAFAGATIELLAMASLKYNVISKNVVTITGA